MVYDTHDECCEPFSFWHLNIFFQNIIQGFFCEFYLYIIIIYDWINIIVRSLSAKYGPDRYRRDKSVKFGTELP